MCVIMASKGIVDQNGNYQMYVCGWILYEQS